MQPLVYYCRWQRAKLRLRGRDETSVWGELVFAAGMPDEWTQRFHYHLQEQVITLDTTEGQKVMKLDEMGVVASRPEDQ